MRAPPDGVLGRLPSLCKSFLHGPSRPQDLSASDIQCATAYTSTRLLLEEHSNLTCSIVEHHCCPNNLLNSGIPLLTKQYQRRRTPRHVSDRRSTISA